MVQELFSQGLQDVDSGLAGVYNPYLGRPVQAFLFIDVTTLLIMQDKGRTADPDPRVYELL